jgi:hypothetical protein
MDFPAKIESTVRTRKWLEITGNSQDQKPSGEDRTAIELFIAGVRGWKSELQRFLNDSAGRK